jgi:hypothetical protein
METLQEILDNFNKLKVAKVKEAKISHIVGAHRASQVRLELAKIRKQERENTPIDPFVIQQKEMAKMENKKMRVKNGKLLGSTKGAAMLKLHGDRGRELSKVPTICPNCNTVGPLSNMKQYHFDKCVRTKGYSNELIISQYKSQKSISKIAQESSVSKPQVKLIIRKWKASNNI